MYTYTYIHIYVYRLKFIRATLKMFFDIFHYFSALPQWAQFEETILLEEKVM